MKRLLAVQVGALLLAVAFGAIGWSTSDRESWVAATLCGVAGVVTGVILVIAAIIERRVLFAAGGLVLGAIAFLGAWWSLIIGYATSDAEGRPVRLNGRGRRGTRWAAGPKPDVARDPVEGARWLAAARAEHASVPAFARLAYQLWAHGAPPELIARAHQAALDEIRHARTSFAVAEAYLGERTHADALALGELDAGTRLQLATESLNDGVWGEGRAARRLEARASATNDAALREVLEQIAREERGHARLAEDIVRWLRTASS